MCLANLFSCTKIQETVSGDEFRVNIRVTRSDDFAATKATVKSQWADGDMIYLFSTKTESGADYSAPSAVAGPDTQMDTWSLTDAHCGRVGP